MRTSAERLLTRYVEHGRQTTEEVVEVLRRCATSSFTSLRGRPYLQVSLPGQAVASLAEEVMFGVPGQVLDDAAIRKVGRVCPEVWIDARWFPADVSGIHLVQVRCLTVVDPDGIPADVAAMLDVPADEARFGGGEDDRRPRFVRLSWRL